VINVRHGFRRERTCRDEDPLFRTFAVESAYESLDLGSSDGAFALFCLEVHNVEAEPIFADNAVNSFVAAFSDGLAGIRTRAAASPKV
jgi:hypothetical protein